MSREATRNGTTRDVDVITTHVGADFDALASMLAAAKLYPEAMLVFPGSSERNLRDFFVESTCYFYNFVKIKEVPFERVGRLIIVDTNHSDRIGPLKDLALNPEVEVHLYDHHPQDESDLTPRLAVVEQLGSTVTVISRILREKRVEVGEDEATLMMLGIHEDTGSFTFPSTTQRDLEAASWLLGLGANLNVVSSLITRELTPEEVDLLHDMIQEAQGLVIGGVEVVVTTVSRERYVPDFAVLVHKYMDMEDLEALFALARMEGRIHLVARSRRPEVDAGAIAKALGGGGHSTAASAALKDMTLVEAKERLHAVLRSHINPTQRAEDLMSSPAVTVGPTRSVAETHEILNRYTLDSLPVTSREGVVEGIIARETVEKAIYHGLGGLAVSEYMDRRVESVLPQGTLAEVEEVLLGRKQRLLPVVAEGQLLGVITRTDLLDALIEHPPLPVYPQRLGEGGGHGLRNKIVKGLMRERLPKEVVEVLMELGRVGAELKMGVYLVGGSVRDLLLRRRNLDLDVVVEGDGEAFARAFGKGRADLKVRSHKKFRTAKLFFDSGLVIDVATARLEYYRSPASLPVVELSNLKLDLYRRDFTINTLAVSLMPGQFGQLVDFFDGLRDLKEKAIRVLHNLSFVEDPTRVFRAVRFEQRFGFRIGRLSEALIKNAIKIDAFSRLSGNRLMSELEQILEEDTVLDCLQRLDELGLLVQIHPSLKLDERLMALLEEVEGTLSWYRLSFLDQPVRQWLAYLLGLADHLKEDETEALCRRLALAPRLRQEFLTQRASALKSLHELQRQRPRPSRSHELLQGLLPEYQLYIMAKTDRDWVKKAVSQYMTTLSKVRTHLGGEDLKDLGLEPGPEFKQILDRVLAARLDGEVSTRDEEAALVRREFGHLMEKTA